MNVQGKKEIKKAPNEHVKYCKIVQSHKNAPKITAIMNITMLPFLFLYALLARSFAEEGIEVMKKYLKN